MEQLELWMVKSRLNNKGIAENLEDSALGRKIKNDTQYDLFRKGPYSTDEDGQLLKAINEATESYSKDRNEGIKILFREGKSNDKETLEIRQKVWAEIFTHLPHRTHTSIKERARRLLIYSSCNKPNSLEDDKNLFACLLDYRRESPTSQIGWKAIQERLRINASPEYLRHRFTMMSGPKRRQIYNLLGSSAVEDAERLGLLSLNNIKESDKVAFGLDSTKIDDSFEGENADSSAVYSFNMVPLPKRINPAGISDLIVKAVRSLTKQDWPLFNIPWRRISLLVGLSYQRCVCVYSEAFNAMYLGSVGIHPALLYRLYIRRTLNSDTDTFNAILGSTCAPFFRTKYIAKKVWVELALEICREDILEITKLSMEELKKKGITNNIVLFNKCIDKPVFRDLTKKIGKKLAIKKNAEADDKMLYKALLKCVPSEKTAEKESNQSSQKVIQEINKLNGEATELEENDYGALLSKLFAPGAANTQDTRLPGTQSDDNDEEFEEELDTDIDEVRKSKSRKKMKRANDNDDSDGGKKKKKKKSKKSKRDKSRAHSSEKKSSKKSKKSKKESRDSNDDDTLTLEKKRGKRSDEEAEVARYEQSKECEEKGRNAEQAIEIETPANVSKRKKPEGAEESVGLEKQKRKKKLPREEQLEMPPSLVHVASPMEVQIPTEPSKKTSKRKTSKLSVIAENSVAELQGNASKEREQATIQTQSLSPPPEKKRKKTQSPASEKPGDQQQSLRDTEPEKLIAPAKPSLLSERRTQSKKKNQLFTENEDQSELVQPMALIEVESTNTIAAADAFGSFKQSKSSHAKENEKEIVHSKKSTKSSRPAPSDNTTLEDHSSTHTAFFKDAESQESPQAQNEASFISNPQTSSLSAVEKRISKSRNFEISKDRKLAKSISSLLKPVVQESQKLLASHTSRAYEPPVSLESPTKRANRYSNVDSDRLKSRRAKITLPNRRPEDVAESLSTRVTSLEYMDNTPASDSLHQRTSEDWLGQLAFSTKQWEKERILENSIMEGIPSVTSPLEKKKGKRRKSMFDSISAFHSLPSVSNDVLEHSPVNDKQNI